MGLRSAAIFVLGAGLAGGERRAEAAPPGAGQCGEDAMIVFDGSGSMSKVGSNAQGVPRIDTARRAVRVAVPEIARGRRLGLVVYGPGPEGSCDNIDLRFPPQENAADRIVAEVEVLEPGGDTPLTGAVEEAAAVLQKQGRGGTVLLVTDGRETCKRQPCELAARLAREAPNLTVHVVGFEVRSSYFSWDAHYGKGPGEARCLADETGGRYVEAETVEELVEAIRDALGCRHIAGELRRAFIASRPAARPSLGGFAHPDGRRPAPPNRPGISDRGDRGSPPPPR